MRGGGEATNKKLIKMNETTDQSLMHLGVGKIVRNKNSEGDDAFVTLHLFTNRERRVTASILKYTCLLFSVLYFNPNRTKYYKILLDIGAVRACIPRGVMTQSP